MQYDLDTGAHSVYSLYHHLVLVVKYRRNVFTEERTGFLHEVANGFTDNYGVEIKNLEADEDHVHILYKAEPTTDLAKFVNVSESAGRAK